MHARLWTYWLYVCRRCSMPKCGLAALQATTVWQKDLCTMWYYSLARHRGATACVPHVLLQPCMPTCGLTALHAFYMPPWWTCSLLHATFSGLTAFNIQGIYEYDCNLKFGGIIREVYLNMCIIHLETSTKTSPKYRSPTFPTY